MKKKSFNSLKEEQHENFKKTILEKRKKKLKRGRSKSSSLWFGLGMFGIVGWSIAIPTIAGVLIGAWVDSKIESPFSWTLMLLALGILIGSVNAWLWMKREQKNIIEERKDE